MSRFNKVPKAPVITSPIRTVSTTVTALGGKGFERTWQGELYLLGLTNYVSEDTAHEVAKKRDDRFNSLVRKAARDDMDWLLGFARYLRQDIGMRSASLVLAAVAVCERTSLGKHKGNADLIDSVLQRADEPGEFVAFWRSTFTRKLPKSVKKGVARAAVRLYHERSYLRWDSGSKAYHFADVIDIVCPTPKDADQSRFFKFLLDQRHHGDGSLDGLPVVTANAEWRRLLSEASTPFEYERLLGYDFIHNAGLKWENVLSALGSKVGKAELWEAMIPHMSYVQLLRNLRNFDERGVSDKVATVVAQRLADPEAVTGSKTFPMAIHAAFRATSSLRWGWALELALKHSLANVPELKGRTLILVDTSTSMKDSFSEDGTVKRWDAAVLFGLALAQKCESVDVVSFSSAQYYVSDRPGAKTKQFHLTRGEALLKAISRWDGDGFFLGGGTDTAAALRQHFHGHDRVVIVTDEQAGVDPQAVSDAIPKTVPMHTLNLAGYKAGHGKSGVRNRYVTGGLTDKAFTQIGLVESGAKATWPWLS